MTANRSDHYTSKLASFAASLRFEDIPGSVIEHAKICLLDTVGCGLFGSTLPWSRILVDSLLEFERDGMCTVWGQPAENVSCGGGVGQWNDGPRLRTGRFA